MGAAMDLLNASFPVIHSIIFLIGASSNIALLLASFFRTPRALTNYSIMIKIGTLNDLVAICCDFFTMQRMAAIPGNLIYLSMGPCGLISARACYMGYCMQLCALIYSFYVMSASFAYRLYILNRPSPSSSHVLFVMLALYVPATLVSGSFTFAQADTEVLREFLLSHAPSYLTEPGALTGTFSYFSNNLITRILGHSGMTPHLIFTILFVVFTPGPAYVVIMFCRHKIISKLRQHSTDMSERTRKMHSNLVQALTVHAMLPPITLFAVGMYPIMFFDIYRHAVLEKAMYAIAAIPTALSSLCTIYYVEPYKRFILCQAIRASIFTPSAASQTLPRTKKSMQMTLH